MSKLYRSFNLVKIYIKIDWFFSCIYWKISTRIWWRIC